MHEAILLEAEEKPHKLKHSLTLMRNCSAALLPPVSKRFLKAFGAGSTEPFTVVPTYAMTESFPICSNPPHLQCKLSTVGPAMGPTIRILQGHPDDEPVKPGCEGEVCVQGACVTAGYLIREHMSVDPNIEAFSLASSGVGRMLRTGDKGYVDDDGYLQLVGRFKEIINCGGEKISPLELEDQLLKVRGVQTCVCFATPADLLGEVVGIAVVVKSGETPPTIEELRQGVTTVSNRFKPAVCVYMDAIPKGPTGKPKRIGLAQQLKIPALVEGTATYAVAGVGDNLGELLTCAHKINGYTGRMDGEAVRVPTWQFPLVIDLHMSPDLGYFHQTRHVLEIHDPACNTVKLTIYTFDAGGEPMPVEFPISRQDAKDALDYARFRTIMYGMKWESSIPPADSTLTREDFAADLTFHDDAKKLEHTWRVGCHDSPPGKMMRLLKVFECGVGTEPEQLPASAGTPLQMAVPVS